MSENKRQETIEAYDILDTPPEQEFNDIIMLASQICDTKVSLISILEESRQWFKAEKGLGISETPREYAMCNYTVKQDDIMEVNDASKDERFSSNPLVTGEPFIRFYAGFPLKVSNGEKLGALCVIDENPKKLNEHQRFALRVLGNQVVKLLEEKKLNKEMTRAIDEARKQRKKAERLSQHSGKLVSVISHDIRGPLQSINSTLELLNSGDLTWNDAKSIVGSLKKSVSKTNILLSQLLNWSVTIQNQDEDMWTSLSDVTTELEEYFQDSLLDKQNTLHFKIARNWEMRVIWESILFVLRNLIQNANKFTEKGTITVALKESGDQMVLSVSDTGIGMNEETAKNLFNWEKKQSRSGTSGEMGSGVGLLLVNDFVNDLSGSIKVVSKIGVGTTISLILSKHLFSKA